MSWVARMLEQRLAEAAEAGELDAGPLQGRPIADLDEHRPAGWWAEQFVRRELSHDRRVVAAAAAAKARAGFWRAESEADVVELVRMANQAMLRANVNLVASDRLEAFDRFEIVDAWRALRRSSPPATAR